MSESKKIGDAVQKHAAKEVEAHCCAFLKMFDCFFCGEEEVFCCML